MILKHVIKYTNANALEALWVEVVTPEQVIPESIDPETGDVTPEKIIPAVETVIRRQAYCDRQMDILRQDIWDEMTPEYEVMIQEVESNQEPLPDTPTLPLTVSKYKFRKALNALGLREAVEAAVAASTDIEIQDAWNFADEYRGDDPLVIALGSALGKTPAEIRGVFELAATL